MTVDKETFSKIIEMTPLVSIDLVIRNQVDEILLGYRTNRPAQYYWFVPGGRIRKNERIQNALKRIARDELGIELGSGMLIGAFDHLYEDNVFGISNVNTHYVVIAFEFEVDKDTHLVKDDQHTDLKWWKGEELLASDAVHTNTKAYFQRASERGYKGKDI